MAELSSVDRSAFKRNCIELSLPSIKRTEQNTKKKKKWRRIENGKSDDDSSFEKVRYDREEASSWRFQMNGSIDFIDYFLRCISHRVGER